MEIKDDMEVRERVAKVIYENKEFSKGKDIHKCGVLADQILALFPKVMSEEKQTIICKCNTCLNNGHNYPSPSSPCWGCKPFGTAKRYSPAFKIPSKVEYCECKPEDRLLCRAIECDACHTCDKPIKPEPKKEIISEIHLNPDGRNHWMFLQDKINELVRAFNNQK